jgi:hypothetical protein
MAVCSLQNDSGFCKPDAPNALVAKIFSERQTGGRSRAVPAKASAS